MSHPGNDHFEETAREAEEEMTDAQWHQQQEFERQEEFSKWAHPDEHQWHKDMESDFQKAMKDD